MAEETIIVIGDDRLQLKLQSKDPAHSARQIVSDTADHLVSTAKFKVPIITGNLQRSIESEGPINIGGGVYAAYVKVGKLAPYAKYVEYGTGIFGKKGSPIRPKTGNVLAWEENGKTFFANEVKGQEGQHFMRDSYEIVKNEYLPAKVYIESKELAD